MITTALLLGFAGSMHCLGMCSPLVMTVSNMNSKAMVNRFVYNAGRILVYGVLGAIVASAGFVFSFTQFQDVLSIAMGVVLLVISFAEMKTINIPFVSSMLLKLSVALKGLFAKSLQKKNYLSLFSLGALNGLLPCGLTFLALTYCITVENPLDGFCFMLLFGAGTLPVMVGATGLIHLVIKKFKLSASKISMAMMILSGLLLIARVLFVNIPHHDLQGSVADIVICR